jgi:hypothetical protein
MISFQERHESNENVLKEKGRRNSGTSEVSDVIRFQARK